mmetsp:Transcript_35631/g.80375  ORF Transcript_35631/g.80375 Transcript_35631/m.80375 type:complete len:90 (+) Transcript_35631:433-702(+)
MGLRFSQFLDVSTEDPRELPLMRDPLEAAEPEEMFRPIKARPIPPELGPRLPGLPSLPRLALPHMPLRLPPARLPARLPPARLPARLPA